MIELVKPSLERLDAYVDALERGWSRATLRRGGAFDDLGRIEADREGFLRELDDPQAKGPPIPALDGSFITRLPGFHRWMWDGEFCGAIGIRWQPGTSQLPPHVLGHVGYTVVPWKRGRGYATSALALLLPEARLLGLTYIELTTDPDNVASQRVIQKNGGVFAERFRSGPEYGTVDLFRYRIQL